MNKSIYKKSMFYAVLFVLLGIISYLFINSGINTKTKLKVDYKEDNDISYVVHLLDNDIYNTKYLDMDQKYLSNLVDKINVMFKYNNTFGQYVTGYYRYNITGTIITYEDNQSDVLWRRDDVLLDDKTVVLNQNKINTINIDDSILVDYVKYRDEIIKFNKDYNLSVSGYLLLSMNVSFNLNFDTLEHKFENDDNLYIKIPLTDDTFRIARLGNEDKVETYYEYTTKESFNYYFLVIGIVFFALTMASLVSVIRQFVLISNRQSKYTKELRKILREYDDKIVNVNKLYNKKKYNLIYVDSFEELMDVYNKVNVPISYKEVKRGAEAIFVVIDDNNAWIYKLESI